ncbi:MAG: aldose 1-epimerase family protein [Bacilli bacterium]|jgi:hypothetical protein|nr:aldose 1-epimerase family protein [Bacilli bacterium]
MINPYIGNEWQLSGVEEYSMLGGKKEGMRIVHVRNGLGLDLYISLDRGGDICNLTYQGKNVNYLTPNGLVSSKYFDPKGDGWIKSFTAGFITTCGLENVGSPNVDQGEELGLHGSRSQIPVENWGYDEDEESFDIKTVLRDEGIFKRKWKIIRHIIVSKVENIFSIQDEIINTSGEEQPLEYLFHINFGYPLLSEDSEIYIASDKVKARNKHAEEDIANWAKMEKPQVGYEERCYYHHMKTKEGKAAIFNQKAGFGACLSFDSSVLDCFTEWKMMGFRDYVLGLEPGNCTPDGRDQVRKQGILKFVKANDAVIYRVDVSILKDHKEFLKLK